MRITIKQRLRDEAVDAYVDWLELCFYVQRAYDRWARAQRSQADTAFREYQDALVREEHSSLRYALAVGSLLR